jgi:hypothetical protein
MVIPDEGSAGGSILSDDRSRHNRPRKQIRDPLCRDSSGMFGNGPVIEPMRATSHLNPHSNQLGKTPELITSLFFGFKHSGESVLSSESEKSDAASRRERRQSLEAGCRQVHSQPEIPSSLEQAGTRSPRPDLHPSRHC